MILRTLITLSLATLLASCGTPTNPSSGNNTKFLSHEVVIDQKTGFLYTGNANHVGKFRRTATSHLFLQVSSDGEPAENPAAARLLKAFPDEFPATANFHPDGHHKGVISTAGGRFEALGTLNAARDEFQGTWFFDDLEGGNIHIAPRGTIFP